MKIHEFRKFLVPFDEQITDPTCDETEFNWADYFLAVYQADQKLVTNKICILNHNIEVQVIKKPHKYGAMTNLVISPLPGLVLDYYGNSKRPLLRVPVDMHNNITNFKKIVENEMEIDVYDPGWYIQTLIKMICKVVKGPFDQAGFSETLNEYQAYRDSGGVIY